METERRVRGDNGKSSPERSQRELPDKAPRATATFTFAGRTYRGTGENLTEALAAAELVAPT